MKAKKISSLVAALVASTTSGIAHAENYSYSMMWDGPWYHDAGHMMGYNMWGMGWTGLLIGLSVWILVILGIVYLAKKISEA